MIDTRYYDHIHNNTFAFIQLTNFGHYHYLIHTKKLIKFLDKNVQFMTKLESFSNLSIL